MLAVGLESAIDMLTARGRCVVLSYHSGEDRLVKQCFARAASGRVRLPAGAALRVRSRGDSACPYERGSARRPRRRWLGTLARPVPGCGPRSDSCKGRLDDPARACRHHRHSPGTPHE